MGCGLAALGRRLRARLGAGLGRISILTQTRAEKDMNARTNCLLRRAMVLLGVLSLTRGIPAELAADTYTSIDVPGARETQAFGINEAGDLVGRYTDAANRVVGFLLSQGKFTAIDLSDVLTTAASNNNAGDIVGRFTDSDN